MTTKVKEMPVVSKMFCSSNQVVLVVRSRPHVVGGGGFVVTDLGSHEVVFRVDGCGVLGKKDQMTLTDAYQNPLLLIRLKVNSYPTIYQIRTLLLYILGFCMNSFSCRQA